MRVISPAVGGMATPSLRDGPALLEDLCFELMISNAVLAESKREIDLAKFYLFMEMNRMESRSENT